MAKFLGTLSSNLEVVHRQFRLQPIEKKQGFKIKISHACEPHFECNTTTGELVSFLLSFSTFRVFSSALSAGVETLLTARRSRPMCVRNHYLDTL